MIKGTAVDSAAFREELIRNFAALPTGSQEFGYAHAASDWDFFAPWGFGVEVQLARLGFEVSHAHIYHDRGIVGVMTHHEMKIDIILVEDMDVRKIFTRFLKAYKLTSIAKLEKYERNDLYQTVMNMLIAQKEFDTNQAKQR